MVYIIMIYKLFYFKDCEYNFNDTLKSIIDNININIDIVIKIGDIDTIKYEWNIIKNLRKYIPNGIPKYICSPKKYNNKMALILPFYQYNSIYKAVWGMDNIDILKSLINQVFINMFLSFHYFGFVYITNNNFFKKILIDETEEETFKYSYKSHYETSMRTFILETNGYKAIMTDFDKSNFVHKKDGIINYWKSIYNFIQSINELDIKINNYNTIINFIETQIQIGGDYDNSIKLHYLLLSSKYKLNVIYNEKIEKELI